ncbi:hypothetical protein EV2_039214 [Malus domestica]
MEFSDLFLEQVCFLGIAVLLNKISSNCSSSSLVPPFEMVAFNPAASPQDSGLLERLAISLFLCPKISSRSRTARIKSEFDS